MGQEGQSKKKMPVLFLGHGSPMNAIQKNDFTHALNLLGKRITPPKSILVVSAHWLTNGTSVTRMSKPQTIHDFHGFPQELFAVQYPAPGDPQLADQIRAQILDPKIKADEGEWGLDHGTWSVLRHLYPEANVPVIQLSIDAQKRNEFHFELGRKLQGLREQGVLIVGSGNVVHNLRKISWDPHAKAFDWAIEFDEWVAMKLKAKDFKALTTDATLSASGKLSIPTWEHYLPLLYVLGAAQAEEDLQFDYEGIQHGSISMRCARFG